MTTTPIIDVSAPVARYAERLHAVAGGTHHVASPLGAWLLLALCGPAASGPARVGLATALGTEPEAAARTAAALLDTPHALVHAAAAAWHRRDLEAPSLAGWSAGLPRAMAVGPLPSQPALDAWARERTDGLIDRFPGTPDRATLLVLASALSTRVSWEWPFDAVPAGDLGAGTAWAGQLREVLRSPEGRRHTQYIAPTDRAGEVAVHVAEAQTVTTGTGRDGLAVMSVAAAEDVSPADVLAAAYELADTLRTGRAAPRRSLFDLPLGTGPAWTLTERPTRTTVPDGREERCVSVLPAWSARSEHDLGAAGLGFAPAAEALAGLLDVDGFDYAAKQAAVARYSRFGFEAAAVSAMAVALGFQQPRDGVVRTAVLRYGHPFAVVAVATQGGVDPATGSWTAGPWHGMPVFSAWVAEVEDA